MWDIALRRLGTRFRKGADRSPYYAPFAEQLEAREMPSAVNFAVIGDYGDGSSNEQAVAKLVQSWNPGFVATVGDNNYPLGDSSTIDAHVGQFYQNFIYPYKGGYGPGGATNEFWPTLGSHDWLTNNAQPYLNYFTLPGNGRYYTVTEGPVQLFIIDGEAFEPDGHTYPSLQASWLQSQLEASTASWKLVFSYNPPYSSGGVHGSAYWMQWPYQAWGATAVLSGSDHDYERLLENNNFPYFVDGASGAGLYSFDVNGPVPGSQVRYDANYGAMEVQANDTEITFQFIDITGAIVDTYSIPLLAPAAPSNLSATASGTGSLSVTWTDNSLNETGFKLERSTDGSNFTQIATVGPNVTAYNDSGLTAGTAYYYRVEAYDAAGSSGYSNVAQGVARGVAALLSVSAPTSVTAGSTVSFSVSAVDAYGNNATGYSGTVHFTSSDGQASLPADYTFTSGDHGSHTFSASFITSGTQSLTATDTTTSSITGTQSGISVTHATYYVSLTGSDSNPGTFNAPFRTINHGVGVLHPGDTLYVRAGTYAESLLNTIPSGTSWSVPISVSAYTGETVTMQPSSGSQYALEFLGSSHYIVINGLNLDGTNLTSSGSDFYIDASGGVFPDHILFENAEVKNSPNSGILVNGQTGASSTYDQFVNLIVHNNGSPTRNHGFYISGSNILIDHCQSYSNGGEGIQIYESNGVNGAVASYNTVRYCQLHDNGTGGLNSNIGLGIYTGNGNVAYNNLIWNNGIGISVELGATNALIYNNTFYHNTYNGGIRVGYTKPASSGTIIKNNVFNNNSQTILNYESGLTEDYNVLDGAVVLGGSGWLAPGSGAHDVSSTNPMFVNASNHDFHLQSGSPAIDKGTTLTQVPDDFDGVSRPQGPAYDIGAYELPEPASSLSVSGFQSPATAGAASTFTVTAEDSYGQTAFAYRGTIYFSSTDSQASLPAGYTFTATDHGQHSFSATLKTAGSQSLTATDTNNSSITGSQTGITVNPAAASTLTVSGPSSATAGTALNVMVTAQDAYGNTATGYIGTVGFASSDPQASLPGNYTFVGSDQGTHTFSVTLKTAGNQSLTFTDTSNSSIIASQASITVSPAAASNLSFSEDGLPSMGTAGAANKFTVVAEDAYGNIATGYAGTVHFSSSDPQAALPADAGLSNGVGTFTVTLKTAGTQSLTFADISNKSLTETESGITVSPGATSTLIVGAPFITTAGTTYGVTVTAQDAYGNTSVGYAGTVHFTSTDSQAALPADYTFMPANQGVHTFSVTLKTAGSQSLTATDTNNSSITGSQTGIPVSPAAASTLTVAGFPSPTIAGTAASFTVTAKDPYGNTAAGYSGTVHFSSSDSQAALPANSTLSNGTGTFSATLETVGSQSLTATDTNNSSIAGSQTAITVNPALILTLTVSGPSSTTAGVAFSVTVAARDNYGNIYVGYAGTVHFTSTDSQAVLPTDYTFMPADQGVHTFSVTLKTAGSQSLTATDSNNSSITGSQTGITVNPAAASTLTVAGFPSPATAGTAASVTVTAKDPYGNTAAGYSSTVHFTSSDSQAALPANSTLSNGTGTFSVTLKTAGSQSLTATDTNNSSITGSQTGITVNPALILTLTVSGPSSTTAGVAFSVTVTARDIYGNIYVGYAGTVHFTSTDSQAVLPTDYTFMPADQGVHTFSVTLKTAGSQSLVATDTNNSSITGSQTGITVNPVAASTLTVAGFPSPAIAGAAGSVAVTAKDPYGNTATGYSGTVHFSSSDSQAVLPANATLSNGTGTFSVTLKTAGSQSLTATDTNNSSITGSQTGITVNPAAASTLTVAGFPSPAAAGTAGSFTVAAKDPYGNTATGYSGTVHFTSSDGQASLPANYTFTSSDQGSHTFSASFTTSGTQSLTVTDTATSSITGTQSGISVIDAIYYVSLSGSDSNPGTFNSPFRTLNHGVSVLRPGDTLYIRGGTYAESLLNTIPSGTSWSVPITVAAYTGETVTLQPSSSSQYALEFFGSSRYIVINGLNLDGTNLSSSGSDFYIGVSGGVFPDHILFENAEVKNSPRSGVFVSGQTGASSNYDEFINLTVHNSGSATRNHGFYISGSDILIDHCQSYSNGGEGIQIYQTNGVNGAVASYNTVRYCQLHDNGTGGLSSNIGLGIYTGNGNVAYNNLIWNNGIGIAVEIGATNALIYNNTFYHNTYNGGIRVGYTRPASSGTVIKNNLFNNNSQTILNYESGLTEDYNLLDAAVVLGGSGSLAPGSGAHNVSSTNPMFVNVSSHNFHLQSGSPAEDKGTTLTQVPDDFDGVSRPQGPAYDIGAYEYPYPASSLSVSGFQSPATAGAAGSFTVTAQDGYGHTAFGYTGTVSFSSTDSQASLPASYTFTAADHGQHTFSATLKTAGSQSLTATDTNNSSITGSQSGITVNPATAGRLVVSGPSSATAGTAFNITVTAQDAYGNTATGYTGTVGFASSDPQPSLPGNYTFVAGDQGVHTFSVTLNTAGSQTITVTDTSQPSITGTATVNVGATPSVNAGTESAAGVVGPAGYTPAQIRHAYGFDEIEFPGSNAPDGSGTVIAIVDAYDDPNVGRDLHQFDLQFGLPDPTLIEVNQSGGTTLPAADKEWAREIALDVEWAHAIAPRAKILLVEAKDNSYKNLLAAVDYARQQPGVVVVSMSWGADFLSPPSDDPDFQTPPGHPGVAFVASSGDNGAAVSYLAASPDVLAVGGTTLNLGARNDTYVSETVWPGSPGGPTPYQTQAAYQPGGVIQSSAHRRSPDVAYDADPNTGFAVYDSYNNPAGLPWSRLGGTSAGAPQWAALIAIADQGRALAGKGSLDGPTVVSLISKLPVTDFHTVPIDVSTDLLYRWGLVTGRGSPVANRVVADLVNDSPVTRIIVGIPSPTATSGASSVSPAFFKPSNSTLQASSSTTVFMAAAATFSSAGGKGFWDTGGIISNNTPLSVPGECPLHVDRGENTLPGGRELYTLPVGTSVSRVKYTPDCDANVEALCALMARWGSMDTDLAGG